MPLDNPSLSIVIPCFNQGHFLHEALESVEALKYDNIEVILVDDGSTDATAAIAKNYNVKYLYQENLGLASARNKGVSVASGEYISCLDADDWYLPENIISNLHLLHMYDEVAFISGCHIIHYLDGHEFNYCINYIEKDHYKYFLEGNYIGNPSAVIYRKAILIQFLFDTSKDIVGCEDYDQYLRISRYHKVMHNPIPISVYRKHNSNMSNNHIMMLNSVLNVLERQKSLINSKAEREALYKGIEHWVSHYNYFPITVNGKPSLQKFHWELIKKYNIRLPEMIIRKLGKQIISKSSQRDQENKI